jgi:hypothetical protein
MHGTYNVKNSIVGVAITFNFHLHLLCFLVCMQLPCTLLTGITKNCHPECESPLFRRENFFSESGSVSIIAEIFAAILLFPLNTLESAAVFHWVIG